LFLGSLRAVQGVATGLATSRRNGEKRDFTSALPSHPAQRG